MTDPNTELFAHEGQAKHEGRSFIIGFVFAVILSAIAFWAVGADMSRHAKLWVIFICALVQIAVHLRFFLHISFVGRESTEDLWLMLFSTMLLLILVAGTLWIMGDLENRMHEPMASTSGHANHGTVNSGNAANAAQPSQAEQ